MTGKDLLIVLGDISLRYYDEAEYDTLDSIGKPKLLRRPLLVAAVVALMLLLVGCAAVYALRLQNLKMGEYSHIQPRYIDAAGNKVAQTEVTREVISLQGVTGSPNFKASQEWFAFEQEYDTDHALLFETDKHPFHAPAEYDAYMVYTQEMVHQVDEIAGKYNLELAGEMVCFEDFETDIFSDSLGIPQLHRQNADIRYASGYFYACGNFKMEFFITPPGLAYEVLGSYRYNGKAYFDVMSTSVSDIENCEEETLRLSDGTEVLLVMDEENVHIFCDRGDAFISLSLNRGNWNRDGTQVNLTKQDAAQIADCFDFSITPKKPDVAQAKQAVQAAFEAYQKEQEAILATSDSPFPKEYASYDDVIQNCLKNGADPETFQYALRDITGDGVDELFLGTDGTFGTIYTTTAEGQIASLWSNGSDFGTSLCEGNTVKYSSTDSEGYDHYNFMKPDPSTGELTQFLSMGYAAWEGRWYYSKSFVDFTYISKEEYDEMVDSYQVIDIGMKPIREYPFS